MTHSRSARSMPLGASPTLYSALFACTAAGTIAGAASNARLSVRWGARRTLAAAAAGNVAVSATLLGIACLHVESIPLTAALVVLSNFCAGIIMPSATHAGLRDLGTVAGSAAALQRSVQMIVGALAGVLVGVIGGHALVAMALAMSASAMVATGFLISLQRFDGGTSAAALNPR